MSEENDNYVYVIDDRNYVRDPNIEEFERALSDLINKYSIERLVDMPDFIIANMICRMLEAMGPNIKATLDWHGCNSVCHPPGKDDCLKVVRKPTTLIISNLPNEAPSNLF